MKQKTAFLDSSFLIAFAHPGDGFHASAHDYLRYFMEEGIVLQVSSIALAEYCVKGELRDLPLMNFRIVNFTARHATRAGKLAAFLFRAKKEGGLSVSQRIVIPNDAKLFAQAVEESSTFLASADSDMSSIFQAVSSDRALSLEMVNIATPYDQRFGTLGLTP